MRRLASFGVAVLALISTSCAVWVTPDTPGNSAIDILVAMQLGDTDEIERLMCQAIAGPVDLDDPSTLGPLEPVYEPTSTRNARGGASEYPPIQALNIPADVAWYEIDFVGESELDREVWRFHMVRETGGWKVCDVEPRPNAQLPPAKLDVINLKTVRRLAGLDAATPENVRANLLHDHSSSDANASCSFEDDVPQSLWSVVATGLWPEKQPNGAYLIAYVEATPDLTQWRAYTTYDCTVRITYP